MSVSPVSRQEPAGGSHPRSTALRAFVEYAVLAPSSHNSQPWRFVVDDDALTLEADTSRALRVADPQDRELVISCGAALAFLRVAIRHAGYEEVVHRFPRPSNPDHLARVSLGERRRADDAADELFAAMAHRRTNRRPFEARPVPTATIEALVATVRAEGGWIRPVTSAEEKDAVAELISRGDRMQGADPAYRRELSAWLRSSAGRARDGVPGTAFGMGTLTSIPFPLFIRLVDWGRVQAARDREIVSHSPALLVLGTDGDDRRAWLRTGEALGMLLLRACASGLSASFLNQPIEVPELRPALASTLKIPGWPQILLRIGYGQPVPPTQRRPVRDVMMG